MCRHSWSTPPPQTWPRPSGSWALLVIQVMAQLMITRKWFIYPLINKDFRVCHPLLPSGNFASVHPNHQKCPRADLLYSSGEFGRLARPRPGVTRCIAHRLTPGLSRCCKRSAATYGEASPPSTSGEGLSHLPLKTNSRRGLRCLGARSRSLSRAGRLVGSPL